MAKNIFLKHITADAGWTRRSRLKKPLTSKVKTNTCHHCGGAINHGRGFDLGAGCFICGRAQSHVCPECVTIPKGTVFDIVNFEVDENETVR